MATSSRGKLGKVSPSLRSSSETGTTDSTSTIGEVRVAASRVDMTGVSRSVSITNPVCELAANPGAAVSAPVRLPVSDLERSKFGIPLDSERWHCLACYDDYCESPDCCGTKSMVRCCCCDGTTIMCRSVHDPIIWRVLWSNSCEVVIPRVCCHRYCQCCCYQCFCALPDLDTAFTDLNVATVDLAAIRDTSRLSGDAVVCLGLVCCFISCRGNLQSCYTHKNSVRQSVLCCHQEALLCDPVYRQPKYLRDNPDMLCLLGKSSWYMAGATHLAKCTWQLGCVDMRLALPCDDDVPCVYSLLPFCACGNGECVPYCCTRLRTFQERADAGPPPVLVPEGVHITRPL